MYNFKRDLEKFASKYYPNQEITYDIRAKYVDYFLKNALSDTCSECMKCKWYVGNNMTETGCVGDKEVCEEYER